MKSNSHSVAAPRAPPCLPPEVTEMCLRFSAQLERERLQQTSRAQIGLLRLISRHFRDVFTKELFNAVTLKLFKGPLQRRSVGFLKIVRKNDVILKHVRHVTIQFYNSEPNLSQAETAQACKVVQLFSQAPLETLVIDGLDTDFPCRPIFNALHTLRCVPSLQALEISGSAVPPFLVCGHFAAIPLKSLRLLCYSFPDESTSENLDLVAGLSIGPDSTLASAFQPFSNVEELGFPNGRDIPRYFPLQDFGSTYYPSNDRIPFTLPALRKLSIGNPDPWDVEDGAPLVAEDYNVLGTLLSRAPRLEALSIADRFGAHRTLDDFAPLVNQLPSLTNLCRLDLVDPCNKRDGAVNSISDILGMFPPISALKTLRIDFRWAMGNVEATRAGLYFSPAWQKLRRALANPALSSLKVLILGIGIEIVHEDEPEETFGPEEVAAFKDTLLRLYAQDGKLDVTVDIRVVDL